MWADNWWLFCDNKERLVCTVNDFFEALLDLNMEPKPESLWSNTFQDEYGATLMVGNRRHTWDLPFMEVFGVLGYRFLRDGKGLQELIERCDGMSESSRPRLQHCLERLCQLAVAGHHVGQGARTGGENSTSHLSSQDVCRRKLGRLQADDSAPCGSWPPDAGLGTGAVKEAFVVLGC